MANRSVNFKIGVDNKDFTKQLNNSSKQIRETEKTANELQKSLAFEWDDKKFGQAQKYAQKALEDTELKAQAIRDQLTYLEQSGGIDTASYEKLQTELVKAETKTVLLRNELDKINNLKFDKASKAMTDFGNKLDNASNKMRGLSLASAGLITAGALAVTSTIKLGDEIQTSADKYDISAESIQRWNYIAMQSDVASEQLYKALSKVRVAIGSQLVGETNTATDALDKLGISFKDFPDADSAFKETIKRLSEIEDKTLQAYLANEIFGQNVAVDLIPLLNQGASGLEKLGKEFDALGYLSNETVAELSEADNMLNSLKTQFKLASAELGIALLPVMKTFANFLQKNVIPSIQNLANLFSNLSPQIQNLAIGTLIITASLSPLLKIGGSIFKMFGSIISILPNLIKLLNGVTLSAWQTYAGFAAIVGAVLLINDLFKNWSEMSAIEKILKSLAVAALVAAAAIMIFHATWSLGIAIGAIVAGIAAGLAALNASKKSLGINEGDFNSSQKTVTPNTEDLKIPDYELDKTNNNTNNNESTTLLNDNSSVVINIYDADSKKTSDIVDEINKYFTQKKLGYR